MYIHFFRLARNPFSISPDPRFLFMSRHHHEALAHLVYGANSGGGVVVLTGEIGTGKTTVCRCFLEQVPANCNVAYIFNPKLTVAELLQSICEEFHIAVSHEGAGRTGVKDYIDALNRYLLTAHAQGRNNVLIIDEAQNLSVDVLEQLRLLTNLETSERKLLQIVLIGQPELREVLARPDLEQLAQRVIARYHLPALSEQETASYIQHRLSTSGLAAASPFQPSLMKQIHQLTQGVPRRINLLCDRALLGAYAGGKREVDRQIVATAALELFGALAPVNRKGARRRRTALAGLAGMMMAGAAAWTLGKGDPVRMLDTRLFAGMFGASRNTPRQPAASVAPQPAQLAAAAAPPPSPATASAPSSVATQAELPQAKPPAPDADTILPEQGTASLALRSEKEALRQLIGLWDVAAPGRNEDPCDAARKSSLRCYSSASGLAELRQLDRPAMLKLRDDANRVYYALLTGLNDSGATLRVGGASQKVSLTALMRHFRGEFTLLWRVPAAFSEAAKQGDHGPHVDWIAAQLAAIYGGARPVADQPFDQRMLAQVVDFQSAQGLFVDGVVGPVTLMHLNRVAGVQEPRLRDGAPAVASRLAYPKE
ncbi:ExeA family protein [Noviherbaspirillum sp. UKPF54]|uniref:ExeA family protein n=1 Tax=Noviherbaspirillum sp. UKPF54 TaxID=2601898 RepID=UPI0011B19585|nr:ExeA family protein [Noviherbaspirillum sp. UKPF54]QDZ26727.1 peptidoglycan-binding protein [Noviherbaspirillum sp. UKPF54]